MQRLPSNSELESVVGERKYPYVFNEGELLQFECLYKYSVKGENKKKKKKRGETNYSKLQRKREGELFSQVIHSINLC